jgi:hypothetical protein
MLSGINAERCVFNVMLGVIMLNSIMLNVVILSAMFLFACLILLT